MTAAERWLAALSPLVRAQLPPPPARVLELGCGPLGGLVPELRAAGYDAVGVDPEAPDEPHYRRIEFERAELPDRVQALVASTSLHHVADPRQVIDRIADALEPEGVLVVVEWDWLRFDRTTADWAFERLRTDEEPSWLHRRRDEWLASGEEWSAFLRSWAEGHGLHPGGDLVRLLDERFERRVFARGPYLFPHLADTSAADEQDAIDAGTVQPTRIDYVATRV